MFRTIWRTAILAMCAFVPWKFASADSLLLPRAEPVVDLADILPAAAEQSLAQQLRTLRQRSGVDLVVVTLPSLQNWSIARWGHELATAWAVGGKSSLGALLIVAADAHQVHIEVGHGLSPMLPDGTAAEIIKTRIAPLFRSGDLAGGTLAGIDAVIKKVMGPASAVSTPRPAPVQSADALRQQWTQPVALAICFAILILVYWTITRFAIWFGRRAARPHSPMSGVQNARGQIVVQGARDNAASWFFGGRARQIGGGNSPNVTRRRHAASGNLGQATRNGSGGRGASRALEGAADGGEGSGPTGIPGRR